MGFRKLKYLLPSYRRAQEREMREELESLSGVAGPRELGNLTLVAENAREAWGWMWLERLSQDLRYAGRSLRRNSSFTAAAILTLALGIGANTAIFTAINAVFFKPLPVKHHKDLRLLSWTSRKRAFAGPILMQPMYDAYILNQGDTIKSFSYPAYEKIRDHTTSFSDISCVRSGLDVSLVSGNHFRMLGVDAYLGRIIAPEDDRIGGPAVADISYGFWQSAFGGDPSVLNKTVKRAATTFRIVGVLPPDFFGLDPGAPLANIQAAMQPAFNKPELLNDHRNWSGGCVAVVGRIRPDVSDEQARAESETFVRQSILEDPPSETYEMPRLWITSADRGLDTLRRKTAFPLLVLMSVASVILWIGCANIAGLQLARGMARQKEIAARLSVGAPRIRIVRQLLTESLALSSIGGVAGGALAYAANPLLPRLFTQFNSYTFNHLGVALTPDLRVLGFCFALTTLTGLLFGLAPAMRATRIDLVSMMKTAPPARTRFHFTSGKTMLGIQVALTTLLLMGTGLFIRTLLNLRAVPLGYDPNGLIWFTIDTDANRSDFVNTVVRRLENLPGVTSATASIWPLFTSAPDTYTPVCESGEAPRKFDDRFADSDFILPRFFETWRVPLLRGRDFEASEGQRNIIVNEAFVRRYLAGKDPIGQTVQVGRACPSWTS